MTLHMAVVVLAGGEGRRMGGEKPRMPWGQTTLIAHALAQARAFGRDVAVAVREERQVEGAIEAQLLLDEPAIEGPLAASRPPLGLRAASAPIVL